MSIGIQGRESAGVDHLDDPNSVGRTGGCYGTRVVRTGEGGTSAAESGTRITRQVSLTGRGSSVMTTFIISMGDLSEAERTQALNAAKMSAPNKKNEISSPNLVQIRGDADLGTLIKEIANSKPEMLESFAAFVDFVNDIIIHEPLLVRGKSYQFRYEEGLLTTSPNCGFRATIAYDRESGMVYVHVLGTEFNFFTETGRETMLADAGIATGVKHPIYDVGVELAQTMRDTFGERCILSGHSLGGSVVQCACAYTGIRAIVLNPAPIHTYFVRDIPPEDLLEKRNSCLQITVTNDIVSDGVVSRLPNTVQFAARKVNVLFHEGKSSTVGASEHVAESVLLSMMLACAKFS
ncbi:MAG: hypothetical protein LBF25_01290 [Puniceicoccales bacterium]|jgi:hypothetical protein|nr:hypothetical protein [Puniceicoccales bacterium]